MNHPIRVLLADRDQDFTESLGRLLDQQYDIKLIGVVHDGQGAVDACKDMLPDVLLIDLHLSILDSVRAIAAIIAHNHRIKILALSVNPADRYAIEAIKAGASGYLEKNKDEEYNTIIEAIRQVVKGDVLLSPALASSILQEFFRISS